jgi:hypothetical protein
MNVSYQLIATDFVAAQRLEQKKGKSRLFWYGAKALALILVFGTLAVVALRNDPLVWQSLRPAFILGLVWGTAIWVLLPLGWRRAFNADRRMQQQVQVGVSDEGLHFLTPNSDANVKWGLFVRYLESDTAFVLYQSSRIMNLIPKRAFGAGEGDQFRELLRQKLPGR